MRKKALGWGALALLGLAGILFFGKGPDSGMREESPKEEQTIPEKVVFLLPYDNPVYRQAVERLAGEFEEEHPRFCVELEWVADRNFEKQLASFLSLKGQVPDMALVDNAYVPLLASGGVLSPLDVWLNQTGLKEVLSTSMEEGLTVEKAQYGCPFLCWSYGLFFQKDILERSGSGIPGSWEEWESCLSQIQRINNVQPFALAAGDSEELMYQFLELLQSQGMILQRMHYESGCQALEMVERLLEQGTLTVDGLNWDQSDLTRIFSRGNLACMLNRSTQIPFLKSLSPSMEWTAAEPCLGPEGRHVMGIQSIVLTKEAGEGAYELLEWLMQKEQVEQFSKEMNSIPVRRDVRKNMQSVRTEDYWSMDWEGRMQFGGSYLSWGSISKEVRSSFRRMLMGERSREECFQEMKYNMAQYLYLLVYE